MKKKNFAGKKGKIGKKKVVISIRPSVVNNRYHNVSSSFQTRSLLSNSVNSAQINKLLSTIKSVRKNNRSLAQALQSKKQELKVSDEIIINLMSEKMALQEELWNHDKISENKLKSVKANLEEGCYLLQEHIKVIQEAMNVCVNNSHIHSATTDDDASNSDSISCSVDKQTHCDQKPGEDTPESERDDVNLMPDVDDNRYDDETQASTLTEAQMLENEHMITHNQRTPFNLTVIEEEGVQSSCRETVNQTIQGNSEEIAVTCSANNLDNVGDDEASLRFFTKRSSSREGSNHTVISPYNSPVISRKSLGSSYSPEPGNRTDYKFFTSKRKNRSVSFCSNETKAVDDECSSIYNLNAEDSNRIDEEPDGAEVQASRKRKGKKANTSDKSKKRKPRKKKGKPVNKLQQDTPINSNERLVLDENIIASPPPTLIEPAVHIKQEILSPLAQENLWNDLDKQMIKEARENRLPAQHDESAGKNHNGTDVSSTLVKQESTGMTLERIKENLSSYQNCEQVKSENLLENSLRCSSRKKKIVMYKERSLGIKLRR